jgi:hypothetical protein
VSNPHSEVEPFSGLGPSDIELVFWRRDQIIGTVVDLVMELGVGDVDAIVHSELIQVRSVRGIEGSAAVVRGVGIVIGDALSPAIVVGAFHASRNFLSTAAVAAVLIGSAFVISRRIRF